MPVTRQWVPVEDAFEKQLVDKLVGDERSFIKGLRYNLSSASALACATLTDCEGSAPLLFVVPAGVEDAARSIEMGNPSIPVWHWRPTVEAMRSLPRAAGRRRLASKEVPPQAEAAAAGAEERT
jgi:hypothetical protein